MSEIKSCVRLGLYGCNRKRTKELLDAANKCYPGRVSVAACFDIDKARVDSMAAEHGAKGCYDLECFQKADYDVAVIALPPFLHPDAFAACAEAGKDIYLEKPVCVDDAGEKKLIAAMRKYHPQCYVGISCAYFMPQRKALELRRRGDGGALVGFHHRLFYPCTGIMPEKDDWRWHAEGSGGELNQHCSHDMHYLRLICGNPESVTAMTYTSPRYQPAHEEEEITACFRLKHGMAVFSLSQRSHRSHLTGHIHMENMAIQYDWAPHSVVKVFKNRPRAAEETYEFDCYPPEPEEENYTLLQMKNFLTAYMGGLPMPITLSDGIQTYRMVRAIRESCKKRCEVPVPSPEVF